MICDFPDCPWQAEHERSDDPTKCVFHAEIDKKRIGDDEFWTQLSRGMMGGNSNFTGFIFPPITRQFPQPFKPNIRFDRATFEGDEKTCADFTGIKFLDVSFDNTVFRKGTVLFKKSIFHGEATFVGATFQNAKAEFVDTTFQKAAIFDNAKFLAGARFESCTYEGDKTTFSNTTFCGMNMTNVVFQKAGVSFADASFEGGKTLFRKVSFEGGLAIFWNARFECDKTLFFMVSFDGGSADFRNSTFMTKDKTSFIECNFSHDARFVDNEIAGELSFIGISFAEKSKFDFVNPKYRASSELPPFVKFERVNFRPFNTFFANIRSPEKSDQPRFPIPIGLIFRHCNLKDVYFSNNDMSLFSFYKSPFFEQAHFTSVNWDSRYERIIRKDRFKRKNLIFEEIYLDEILSKKVPKQWDLEDLDEHWKVAELYRKMKTALDSAKNYHMASWFYFNEFEMKRKGITAGLQKKRLEGKLSLRKRALSSVRLWQYNLYRFFAGYGEKPLWSFVWFWIFTGLFGVIHIFNGVPISDTKSFHYELAWNIPDLFELAGDLFKSVLLSVYRALPHNYLPFDRSYLMNNDLSNWEILLSLTNTIVLTLMIVFTAIGLKRHFRRF